MKVLKPKLTLLVIALFFACAITTLADAESISGNVSDGTGSVPLDHVYVRAYRIDSADRRDTNVDGDGNYTIDVYPENWRVYVMFHGPYDRGYYGHATNGSLTITTPGEYRVTINPGDDVTGYDFEIRTDTTPPTLSEPVLETPNPKANYPIHISVSTSDDSGIQEIYIQGRQKNPYDWFDRWWMIDDDGDGVYEGDIWDGKVTTAGVEYYVEAWDFAGNYVSYPADDPRDNPLVIPPEDIDPPEATISGRVTNDVGEPLESVYIEAWRDAGGGIRTFTDADGNYTAEVRAGTWHLGSRAEVCNYYVIDPPNPDPFGDGDFYIVAVSEGDAITGKDFTMSPDSTPPTIVNLSPEPIIGGSSSDITFKAE
ncbi:MAG: carboxypeptidase-like regulatory domain-containing protein, partial [Candidatus Poribacteria bacterium]